ncbi:MAG: exosortase F system-associated protein [Flavobacteriaceae bacterium]|nr:exosortase F system-associated protein [Flavobacteriaceae bacterium]
MNRIFQIFIIVILVALLAIIRSFSVEIFYDPLILFFEQDYLNNSLPDYDLIKLSFNIIYRYSLNSIVSLAIIYILFKNKDLVYFSFWVFIIGFFVFIIPFYFFIENYQKENYLLLFYIRRFLIQPILLLLLLPAFYYHKITGN